MVILTNEEINFLEDNKYLYEMIQKAGYCRNYTKEVYQSLSDIHIKHIGQHTYTHWCGDCRIQLVTIVYRWYDSITEKNYQEAMEVFASITNDDVPTPKKRGRKPKSQSNI
jgi:hypothetical protein